MMDINNKHLHCSVCGYRGYSASRRMTYGFNKTNGDHQLHQLMVIVCHACDCHRPPPGTILTNTVMRLWSQAGRTQRMEWDQKRAQEEQDQLDEALNLMSQYNGRLAPGGQA